MKIIIKNGKKRYDLSKEKKETLNFIADLEKKQKQADKRFKALQKRLNK